MGTPLLIEAFKYKRWADRRTVDAVGAIDADAHPASLSFARQQLNHMVRVEELFKARLLAEPEPHSSTNTQLVPDLAELDQRLMASNDWFSSYVADADASTLQGHLSFLFVDGNRGTMTREEILFHIINHGTYHSPSGRHVHCLHPCCRAASSQRGLTRRRRWTRASRRCVSRGSGARATGLHVRRQQPSSSAPN